MVPKFLEIYDTGVVSLWVLNDIYPTRCAFGEKAWAWMYSNTIYCVGEMWKETGWLSVHFLLLYLEYKVRGIMDHLFL